MANRPINRTWMKKDKKPKLTKLEKQIEKLKKPGKVYTKAQLLALKRKAQNKSIAEVKAENEAAMRKKAKEKYEAFKKNRKLKIAEKKKKKKKEFQFDYQKDLPNIKFLK